MYHNVADIGEKKKNQMEWNEKLGHITGAVVLNSCSVTVTMYLP